MDMNFDVSQGGYSFCFKSHTLKLQVYPPHKYIQN